MKMTYYRLMCGYESLYPDSIIWFAHKYLAFTYEWFSVINAQFTAEQFNFVALNQ